MIPREWSRGPQWVSDAARADWEPVLHRAVRAWEAIEILSVTAGIRSSALVFLTPDELPVASRDCAANHLELSVLSPLGSAGFRCAVHRRGLGPIWHQAWMTSDDDAIGKLLGFPDCCREFFVREWKGRESTDVTAYMAAVDGPWELNILQRWAGVRLVPHLPCSATCEVSLELARKYLEAGRDGGEDVEAIEAVLRLPVQHDARNGVAIVSTPFWRMLVGTDKTDGQRVLERAQRGDAKPPERELTPWEANGFSSWKAMDDAHAVVLEAVRFVGRVESAIDLGCGNGRLLARILSGQRPNPSRWVGIESDGARVEAGRAPYYPTITFRHQTIQEWAHSALDRPGEGRFDLALITPGRLIEMDPGDSIIVRKALRERVDHIVAYAYGDWIRAHPRGVRGLCDLVGMGASPAPLFATDEVQACIVGREFLA